jgi:hypothetical protein
MNTPISTTHIITDEVVASLVKVAKADSLLADMRGIMIERVRQYKSLGPVVAAIRAEATLGIGGIGHIHKGVGMAWLLLSREFLKYPKSLLKLSRQIITEAFENLHLHRLQIDIDPTYKENVRFAKRLGFLYEGTMLQYGPKRQDYYRFVKLKEHRDECA